MNLGDPQKDALEAITRDDYRSGIGEVDFSNFAFDIAERLQQSDEESDEEGTGNDFSEDFDESRIRLPNANQINENPEIIERYRKDARVDSQVKILNDVEEIISILQQEEISIPETLLKMAKNKNSTLQELKHLKISLNDLYETKLTANYFTDWILQLSVMLSTFFNGENMLPILNIKPNLTGYSTKIKAQTNSLNKENSKIARKINKKIGKSTTTVFKWCSMLLLPLLITLGNNHGNKKLTDYDKHDGFDSDEEEENESASEESAYESGTESE